MRFSVISEKPSLYRADTVPTYATLIWDEERNDISFLDSIDGREDPLTMSKKNTAALATAVLTMLISCVSAAQQQVRLVVPAAPGGATDVTGRLLAGHLGNEWGRTIFVDNKPGAGGTIGSAQVARSAADGNTLLIAALSHSLNPSIFESLPYDAIADFTPIAKLQSSTVVLVVPPSSPFQTFREFVEYAKANPAKLMWGLGAIGTSQQLGGMLLWRELGISVVMVPYKGSGPALTDLRAGHVDFMLDNLPTSLGLVRTGKLRALAIASPQRSPFLPDVPTIAESGVPGFSVEGWTAIVGPAGLSREYVQELYQKLQSMAAKPEAREDFRKTGAELDVRGPEETAKLIKDEMERWRPIIKEAGITAN